MTLLTRGNRHVYLAHPIKTSGTSVANMLKSCGWTTEWRFERQKRLANQPAHMLPDEYLPRLAERGIEPEFHLLVRHPIARIGSFYRYECRYYDKMPPFDFWLNLLMSLRDIRLTPQVRYLPPGRDCQVHRYEDGNPVAAVRAIDPTCRAAPVRSAAGVRLPASRMELKPTTRADLIGYMMDDFEAFGYDPDTNK